MSAIIRRASKGLAGGLLLGALAGLLAAATELGANLAWGAVVPLWVRIWLCGAYAAAGGVLGAVAGPLIGLAGDDERRRRVGLGAGPALVMAFYGIARIYHPASLDGEALLAGACVVFGIVMQRPLRLLPRGFISSFASLTFAAAIAAVGATYFLRKWDFQHGALLEIAVLVGPAALVVAGQMALLASLRRLGRLAAPLVVAAEVGLLVTLASLFGHRADLRPLDIEGVARPRAGYPGRRPSVVLISMDTMRADRVSLFGYPRPVTPHIDAFAREATVYARCYSTSGWTLPAHASMLTGLLPAHHGARLPSEREVAGRPTFVSHGVTRPLPYPLGGDALTLAELLHRNGYRTGAVVANSGYLDRSFGLAQGFDFYSDAPNLLFWARPVLLSSERLRSFMPKPYRPAPAINGEALAWLDRDGARPFFLFINYMEPHHPLFPAREDLGRWGCGGGRGQDPYRDGSVHLPPEDGPCLNAAYDSQVRFLDESIGWLLAELKARRLYDPSLIIVTADHGELLGEHGLVGHGHALYEEVVRVPLIVKYPGEHEQKWVDHPVQLTGLLPTVLGVVGLPAAAAVDGTVLSRPAEPVVVEQFASVSLVLRGQGDIYGTLRVLYDGVHKFISSSRGERWLFDLRSDPDETQNLAAERPALAERLARRLDEVARSRGVVSGRRALSPGVVARLRALGYVRDGAKPGEERE